MTIYVSMIDAMQPVIAAMLEIPQAFYAAVIRSILHTTSLPQSIRSLWSSPSNIKSENAVSEEARGGKSRADFLDDVEKVLKRDVRKERLYELSKGLRLQIEESLLEGTLCMLPSYNYLLPTGDEVGKYLALDVGGSTFRVALIQLFGRGNESESKILRIKSVKIDSVVKQLKGCAFFDWMAARIEDTLSGQPEGHGASDDPLSMGLAWSFPIQQTSLRSGLLLEMGKGFLAAHDLLGQDLGDLIQDACQRRGVNVRLDAIVNDSSATLLSKAYLDSTTRFALILGTGVNAAVHLPVQIFSSLKFGVRPPEWHDSARHVIVNTELSMFGKGILPYSRWDEALLKTHPNPDFQPLEHFVSGGYLGEIVRLALLEGIQTAGLFGGVIPPSLVKRYSLETETLSRIEADTSPNLTTGLQIFTSRHPSTHSPAIADLHALQFISSHVAHRAAGIVAAGVHALWELRNEVDDIPAAILEHTLVAYNGSVMESYPGFKKTCQLRLDGLVEASGGRAGLVELTYAKESSLLGAAVAVACLDG